GLALASAPRLLLLDEPLAGLAAAERERVSQLVKRISSEIPVLLVEHDIDRVFALADRVTVMNEGRVLVDGTAEDARGSRAVQEIYIGTGTAALAASALLRAELARAARAEVAVDGAGPADPGGEEAVHEAERTANALLNVGFSATFMLGPALGSLLVAGAGAPAALFIDAVSFLACGALLTDLHPHVEEAAGQSVRARLQAAWQHVNDVPVLRRLLLTEALALVFFEAAAPVEVAYAKAALQVGNSGYGLLLTSWGIGVVLGSAAFARAVTRPLGMMLSVGTLAVGSAYVGLAAAPSLAVACAAALVGGAGQGVQWASLISAVQQLTPPDLHGRMMGAVESLGALSPAIGLSLGGILTALTSPRAALLAVGLGAAATTTAFVRLSLPRSRVANTDAAGEHSTSSVPSTP
ncbi:MAG TPA: MFS transporter, partial [Solirubrobacteraceae bacterium]|nr:MFS transporter [Solirubrobacteraceae bacterium]